MRIREMKVLDACEICDFVNKNIDEVFGDYYNDSFSNYTLECFLEQEENTKMFKKIVRKLKEMGITEDENFLILFEW